MPDVSARAPPRALCRPLPARGTVDRMGDTWNACVGRGDGSGCPHGETGAVTAGRPVYRCVDCRDHWEFNETEPWRRSGDEDA